jgi:hypothetical protein
MQDRQAGSPEQQTARKRREVKRPRADSLRAVRKRKTFAGYALVFIILFTSVLLSLGGVQSLGNALILVAAFWGLLWWRISPKLYRRFVGDVAPCAECGRDVDLIDAWKCPTCGSEEKKHILEPCTACGTRGGKLGCPTCGSSISV